MSSLRRKLGWMLVGTSLLLHFITVICFTRQPEHLAAFIVVPIWFWGGLGLLLSSLAFYFLRASLSLIVTAIWAVTLLVGADEARVLGNLGKEPPLPGLAIPYHGKPVLRVATLNCHSFICGDPAQDLAAWQPDIVLIQEAFPHQIRHIADVIYGGRGDYRCHQTCGIVTRWKIDREVRNPTLRDQQLTILLPNGNKMEVVNIHLASAATDLSLWTRAAWTAHRINRVTRLHEISVILQILEQTIDLPATPTIFGGDFNSPASDIVHRQMSRDFTDAFSTAGTGWGDTFQRRMPILRIDHIYANRHLTPIRCRAVTTKFSDHRMVIADFLTDSITP